MEATFIVSPAYTQHACISVSLDCHESKASNRPVNLYSTSFMIVLLCNFNSGSRSMHQHWELGLNSALLVPLVRLAI